MRARGIEAFGRDLSSYAIEQVPQGLKPYCDCGTIADPISGSYDLVTCIEVLEHMPPNDARRAVENMCRVAPRVLFSSSPTDFAETTHINVQPPVYWMHLFAEQGFGPQCNYDASYICPWAILFERRETTPTWVELDAQARLVLARMTIAENGRKTQSATKERMDKLQALVEALQNQFKISQDDDVKFRDGLLKLETEVEALRNQFKVLQDDGVKSRDRLSKLQTETARLSAAREQELVLWKARLAAREQEASEFRNRIAALEGRWGIFHFGKGRKRLSHVRGNSRRASELSDDEVLVQKSGLLDADWYETSYPDIATYKGGAIRHYLEYGAAEGRDPNPLFSTSWYLRSYPDVAVSGLDPLLHYLKIGSKAGLKPTEEFDPGWYRATYPDVVAAGYEPFFHYLHHGKGEGRRQNAMDKSKDVTDVGIMVRKPPDRAKEVVLFVTHAPAGRIKPHVPIYLDALKLAGLSTIVIVATDRVDAAEVEDLLDRVDGLFVRENGGYDFAAWAHATHRLDLSCTRLLCLVNDSLIGPFNPAALQKIIARTRASNAQLVCLTDNYEFKHHFQSYFLVAKDGGVGVLRDFLGRVRSLENKQEVIMSYELPLLEAFEAKGLTGEALFPTKGSVNRTTMEWRALIEEGFPFVKTEVLRSGEADGWQDVLSANGYDPSVAEESIAVISRGEGILQGAVGYRFPRGIAGDPVRAREVATGYCRRARRSRVPGYGVGTGCRKGPKPTLEAGPQQTEFPALHPSLPLQPTLVGKGGGQVRPTRTQARPKPIPVGIDRCKRHQRCFPWHWLRLRILWVGLRTTRRNRMFWS